MSSLKKKKLDEFSLSRLGWAGLGWDKQQHETCRATALMAVNSQLQARRS